MQGFPRLRGRGFSMIELLVVIAVVLVMVALLLPVLAGARASARMSASASNARTLVQIISMKADERAGELPTFRPGAEYPAPFGGVLQTRPDPAWYWFLNHSWPAWFGVTAEDLGHPEVLVSPGYVTPLGRFGWSYPISSTALADPRVWGDAPLGAGEHLALRSGVRVAQVRHPSSKALLWDDAIGWKHPADVVRVRTAENPWGAFDLLELTPVAAWDVSVRTMRPVEATTPARAKDPDLAAWEGSHPARLHDTRDGVHGLDW